MTLLFRMWVALVATVILTCLPWKEGYAQGAAPLEVGVEQNDFSNPLVVTIRIKNTSGRTINLPKFKLPWGDRYSMVIVGIEPSGRNNPLRTAQFVSVPVTGYVAINPGQTIAGKIDLSYYLEGIRDELATKDILIFWWYNLRLDEPVLDSQYSGAFLLFREKK